MNRAEFHKQAKQLNPEQYDGHAIDRLIDAVRLRVNFDTCATCLHALDTCVCGTSARVTHCDTPSSCASDRLEYTEGESCVHCQAPWGHKRYCPLICRETAEAWSLVNGLASKADKIIAPALGVKL